MVTESHHKRSWKTGSWITIVLFTGLGLATITLTGELLLGACLVAMSLSGVQGLRDRWVIGDDDIRHRSLPSEASWSFADIDRVEEYTPRSQYRLHLVTGERPKMVEGHRMVNQEEMIEALRAFTARHEIAWIEHPDQSSNRNHQSPDG
jgi:hypothetical protein